LLWRDFETFGSLVCGFGFGKLHLNIPNFSIFFSSGKKISSGWVPKYLGQRWVGLLFTAGQKYVQVGLGQSPSVVY